MSKYYIIKVTRKTPALWNGMRSDIEEIHYYNGVKIDRPDMVYKIVFHAEVAITLPEKETTKIVKTIELIYKEYSETNGKLLKIEVLDARTLEIVNMRRFRPKPKPKPEIEISRFELMEL